jgi:hypothetical protein
MLCQQAHGAARLTLLCGIARECSSVRKAVELRMLAYEIEDLKAGRLSLDCPSMSLVSRSRERPNREFRGHST